ncbi:conserved hypothetical protein [Rhodopseudomonas palustris HaA2]|uniref:DUF4148 domain-containing protein n=1 Tax=Rhodopseudomonas palustris (strain HaA2) TaxID=316058 RepID=Q2ITL6_RHOP2|nr:hypothetical protein [Rhodopseudomonas palustris]ABD08444.1 conserved hypothetical protein [Rhodopseudomonas palustris HaA2]
MKLLRGVALSVLLAGPAYAQMPNVNLMPEVQHKSPEEKAQDAIRDKAYRESLRKIPDAKAPSDPWGDVRSNEPATAKPKTATTKSKKTGQAAN